MSLLTNVLKQLEATPAPVPPAPAISLPPAAEAPAEPVQPPHADSPDPCPLPPDPYPPIPLPAPDPLFAIAPASPESIEFDFDPSFAADESLVAAESLVASSLVDPPFVPEPPEPAADPLAGVSIARPFADFWGRLADSLRHPIPASVLLLKAESAADGGWLFPLAAVFAQANPGRVLIVDAASPARGPAIQGITAKFGLTDVLAGATDWRDAIAPTPTPRIDLLIRGRARESAAAAGNVRQLVAELNSAYRLVLTVADDATNPLVGALAGACDAAVIIADLRQTTRTALFRAKRALAACRVPLAGCVIRG